MQSALGRVVIPPRRRRLQRLSCTPSREITGRLALFILPRTVPGRRPDDQTEVNWRRWQRREVWNDYPEQAIAGDALPSRCFTPPPNQPQLVSNDWYSALLRAVLNTKFRRSCLLPDQGPTILRSIPGGSRDARSDLRPDPTGTRRQRPRPRYRRRIACPSPRTAGRVGGRRDRAAAGARVSRVAGCPGGPGPGRLLADRPAIAADADGPVPPPSDRDCGAAAFRVTRARYSTGWPQSLLAPERDRDIPDVATDLAETRSLAANERLEGEPYLEGITPAAAALASGTLISR